MIKYYTGEVKLQNGSKVVVKGKTIAVVRKKIQHKLKKLEAITIKTNK